MAQSIQSSSIPGETQVATPRPWERLIQGAGAPAPPGSWWWSATAGAGALILGVGALLLIWLLGRPLALLLLGITIAAALAPLASWLERRMPRTVAIILIYLSALLIIVVVGAIIIPPLVNQAQRFGGSLPGLIRQGQQWLDQSGMFSSQALTDTLISQLGGAGAALVSLPIAVTSSLIEVLLVVFISLYALMEAPAARRFILSLFPEQGRQRVDSVLHEMSSAMGGYVRGLFLNSLIVGITTTVGLVLIGVDFSLVLGLIAGIMEIIPYLGPLLAGALIVGVALLQSTSKAIIALVFVLVLQQVESNILIPNIMHKQTTASPLLTIVALVAGGTIGGLLGALVAIPLAAAARVLVSSVVAPALRRQTGAPEPGPGEGKKE